MTEPLLDAARFHRGLLWKDYLDHVPRSRGLQAKRYSQLSANDLAPFSELSGVPHALILSAPKCSDSAWALPQMMRYLHAIPGLETRVFFRDDHPDLQDALLTNGKRAVPKLVLLDERFHVIGSWGPRPAPIQQFVYEQVSQGLARNEWYPAVVRYYKESGEPDLRQELLETLMAVHATMR